MEKIIYLDPAHEAAVEREISWCEADVKKLLDAFNAMKLTAVDSAGMLYDLIHRPDERIDTEIRRKALLTGNEVDRLFVNKAPVIQAANKCRQYSEYAKPEKLLFEIEEGELRVNPKVKKQMIEEKRIIARNQTQVEFAEKMREFEILFNELDMMLSGEFLKDREDRLLWGRFFDMPIQPKGVARMNPEKIRSYFLKLNY